jgi:CheY-like chemotaxis protein
VPADEQAARSARGYLILLVDDDVCMRELLREYFERVGFRVVEAENGREAIDIALREKPRLILMNFMMPVMDGLTASRIIHDDPQSSHIPIILNSACEEGEMRPKARRAGCVDFIYAPFDPRELLRKVERHILVG